MSKKKLMSKKKADPSDVLRAISVGDDELLDVDYPEPLVEAELRAVGLDPRVIDANAEAFVEKLLAERPVATSKASGTRLRSTTKASSSLPPVRSKIPSDAD